MAHSLPPEADELYALPLGEFIAARDALAKRLRSTDADAAAAVRKLRKPTVPAWAIDQLVRRERARVDELFELGAVLRDAQRALARGGDPIALQRAATDERALVAALVDAASKILDEAGLRATPAYREAIANTLYATATDDDARVAVESGRADRDYTRVGFGEMPDLSLVPANGGAGPDGAAPPSAPEPSERQRKAEARARWKRLAAAARAAERDADAAERDADDAERTAERARERAGQARAAAHAARTQADEAEAALLHDP